MEKPKVTTDLTCEICGATITRARPLRLDPCGILLYTGRRHVIRFDAGTFTLRCPKETKGEKRDV